MPRQRRNLNFSPPVDATRQDIVDAVASSEAALTEGLEESNYRLERIDLEQQLLLDEEVED